MSQVCYVLSIVLSAFHALLSLILTIILEGRNYCSLFTKKQTTTTNKMKPREVEYLVHN